MKKSKQILALLFGGFIVLLINASGAGDDDSDDAKIQLEVVGTYRPFIYDGDASLAVAHDPQTQQVFVANVAEQTIDVLDISDPEEEEGIERVNQLDVSKLRTSDGNLSGSPTGVAAHKGIVVAAVKRISDPEAETENPDAETEPGEAVFFSADGTYITAIQVGRQPSDVSFTPDGQKVLVANEGEPNEAYTIDPEGSITIIDVSQGVLNATVTTADFEKFNKQRTDLIQRGVRIYGPKAINPDDTDGSDDCEPDDSKNLACVYQDLEPESIAVSDDSKTAYVTLQENNAIAVVDILRSEVIENGILPLGFKDHRLPDNEFDASDRDGAINIRNWAVSGLYLPDRVSAYRISDQTYLVTANEGDERGYEGFNEEARIGEVTLDENFPADDPANAPITDAATLQEGANLGQLRITTVEGDPDGDGDIDQFVSYGGRSFSIWTTDGKQVYDSGEDFERITAQANPEFFNTQSNRNAFDNRSDDRGPEPPAVTTGKVCDRTYAFTGLERIGGIMVYDITDPEKPDFIQYINNRNFDFDPAVECEDEEGNPTPTKNECIEVRDLSAVYVLFIPRLESPIEDPLLVVANDRSGTTTLFQIKRDDDNDDEVEATTDRDASKCAS